MWYKTVITSQISKIEFRSTGFLARRILWGKEMCAYRCECVCVVIPFILNVRLVGAPKPFD